MDGFYLRQPYRRCQRPLEFRAEKSVRRRIDLFLHFKGRIRHIVVNTNRKVGFFGVASFMLSKNCFDHGRRIFFGTKAITPCEDFYEPACFKERRHNVFIQRLAQAAGFLCPVKDRNRLSGSRNRVNERACVKRTVKANLYETVFSPFAFR